MSGFSIDGLSNLVAQITEEENLKRESEKRNKAAEYTSVDVSNAILDSLETTRKIFSLHLHPVPNFFSTMLTSYRFRNDPSIELAHTDTVQKYISINMNEFLKYDRTQRATIVNHLLWHNAFLHQYELPSIPPEQHFRWNLACDIFVNNGLLNLNLIIPQGFPTWEKCAKSGVKDIFEKLPKDLDNLSSSNDGGGSGFGLSSEQNEQLSKTLSSLGIDLGGKNSNVTKMLQDFLPKETISEESIELMQNTQELAISRLGDLFNALGSNSNIHEKDHSLFGFANEFLRISDLFKSPAVNWAERLKMFVRDFCLRNGQRTYQVLNRRQGFATDVRLKGRSPAPRLNDITVVMDVSGSISPTEHLRYFTEVNNIAKSFNLKQTRLLTFDTDICEMFEFKENDLKANVFEQMKLKVGGGTCIQSTLKYLSGKGEYKGQKLPRNKIPNFIIVFTDMEMFIPKKEYPFKIIWCIVKNEKFNLNELKDIKARDKDECIIVPDEFLKR